MYGESELRSRETKSTPLPLLKLGCLEERTPYPSESRDPPLSSVSPFYSSHAVQQGPMGGTSNLHGAARECSAAR